MKEESCNLGIEKEKLTPERRLGNPRYIIFLFEFRYDKIVSYIEDVAPRDTIAILGKAVWHIKYTIN